MAAFQLFDADIDIIDRNGRNPDQTVRVDAAVVNQPVVIDPEARLLHASIVESKQIQHQGRIEHLRAETVFFHFLDSRVGIPSTGVMLESFAHFVGSKAERLRGISSGTPFFQRSTGSMT